MSTSHFLTAVTVDLEPVRVHQAAALAALEAGDSACARGNIEAAQRALEALATRIGTMRGHSA